MKFEFKTAVKIFIFLLVIYMCIHHVEHIKIFFTTILSAVMPLFIGCAIAYPVNILMSFYEKHFFPLSTNKLVIKLRRSACILGAFLSLIGIVAAVIWLIIPQVISCAKVIVDVLPDALNSFGIRMDKLGFMPKSITNMMQSGYNWQSHTDDVLKLFGSGIGSAMTILINAVTSLFSGIVATILGFVFSIYILYSKETLKVQCSKIAKRYMSEKIYSKTTHFLDVLNDCFHKYIVGQCTEAVILGVLCTIGMSILRLPYANMIGALIALTALIPIAGAFIGAFVGAFMIVIISPVKALIFIIFIIVLQQIEGNLIYPKVMGTTLGLPGMWILAAVTVGGGIMGIPGIILSVPIAACAYRLLREDVNKPKKVKES